jgi:hypothetical protein
MAASPTDVAIWRKGVVRTSPAANTPGTDVIMFESTTIKPPSSSFIVPLRNVVLGSSPIQIKQPCAGSCFVSSVSRLFRVTFSTLKSPPISVGTEFHTISILSF